MSSSQTIFYGYNGGTMEHIVSPTRKSPLMNLVIPLTVSVLALIGLIVLPDLLNKVVCTILFGAFAVAHTLIFQRTDNTRILVFYFVLQTLIVIGLLRVFGSNDVLNLLFFILGVQVMLVFSVRVAVLWILLFYGVTAVNSFGVDGANGLVSVIFNAAVFGFTGIYGYTLRQVELARGTNQHLLQELREAQNQMQELAITRERNRLARDLHDSVKQQIFAAAMQLGAARASLSDPITAREHLDETERLVHQAQQELNTLIFELRPVGLGNQGLAAALREYAATWSRQSKIQAEMTVEGERTLAADAEQALFRVAQEALANIARHSGATSVTVRLGFAPTATNLTIQDDGRGFEVTTDFKGIGLNSMYERMVAVGGKLEIESELEHGTRVRATFPSRGGG